jgi:XTP/dITP diphosphohydrolase
MGDPRLLFATTNPGKQREIRRLLEGLPLALLFLQDVEPAQEVEETGTTFLDNARLKAVGYASLLPGGFVAAEDSGLVVPALGGEPGVYSARYGGRPDDVARNAYLLERMAGLSGNDRAAYYEAVIVLLPARADSVTTPCLSTRTSAAPSATPSNRKRTSSATGARPSGP